MLADYCRVLQFVGRPATVFSRLNSSKFIYLFYYSFSVNALYHFNLGHGIFTTRDFEPNEFLLEYRGELISKAEGEKRLKTYSHEMGSFIFFYNDKWYVV